MEHIRPHMGLGVGEDALRRAAGHQLLQNPPVPPVPGAGIQLSVGKSACAPLAKLNVGFRIQWAAPPEGFHVPLPGHGVLPPLQHDGPQAAPGQNKGRKQAPRTGPDDHRRRLRPQHGFLLPQLHCGGVHQPQLLPGVNGPAQHLQGQNIPLRHPQQPRRLSP